MEESEAEIDFLNAHPPTCLLPAVDCSTAFSQVKPDNLVDGLRYNEYAGAGNFRVRLADYLRKAIKGTQLTVDFSHPRL